MADLTALMGAPCTVLDGTSGPPGVSRPRIFPGSRGEPSIGLITLMCVHEHQERALACAGCAAELQQIADALACPACADHPDHSHECRQVMSIKWLSGEKEGDRD